MIVAAVEDLLFSSKIRAVAKALGVEVAFVRDSERLLDEIRQRQPTLVIFDINAERLNPLDAAARMAREPDLSGIRTVGFVSHVQVDLIAAARKAGVGEVMARSMFVTRLPELLSEGPASSGPRPANPS